MILSEKISSVEPSLTLQITAKAKALKAEGVDIVSFGAGEPDFDTPDFIKEKAIEAIQTGFTRYTPAAGIPQLKQAIVKKFKDENGLDYSANQIVVSCGAKHSLFNIFQVLLRPEDEVIIPSPYWLSYPEMVKLAGGTSVYVDAVASNNYKITAKMLEDAITPKTRAVILNSPSNPTGAVYTKEELEAIAQVAVDKNIMVVSDEIYEHLTYGDVKHISIATLNDQIKQRTIIVNGVSKCYAMTGWRIGYVAADEAIVKAISTLQSHSTSNPTSFAQIGALAAIEAGASSVSNMFDTFSKRRDIIMEELAAIPSIKAFQPEGAFYVFCDISATGLSALDFSKRLLEEANVAVIPSEPFGIDGHVRLSFAVSEENIKKGVNRIKEWIDSL